MSFFQSSFKFPPFNVTLFNTSIYLLIKDPNFIHYGKVLVSQIMVAPHSFSHKELKGRGDGETKWKFGYSPRGEQARVRTKALKLQEKVSFIKPQSEGGT